MKTKEKLFLMIMILLFGLSSAMFYYQNVYKSSEYEKSKELVLVATKNINNGANLNEKNVSWIKIDAELVSPNNITKDKENELNSLKVSSNILEGEIINKNRLSDKFDLGNKTNKYSINLMPNFSTDLEDGDLIRVYVQIINDEDKSISNRLVFEKKEVLEIVNNEDGLNSSNQLNSIKIEVTDKEAISYYNAKQKGSIIVLKYREDVSTSDYKIPFIDILE